MNNKMVTLFAAAVLFSLSLMTPVAQAASAILIWPINPSLSAAERARPLWLENQANVPATLQIRILRWQQQGHQSDYQAQEEVLPSPPVVTIPAGERQLVRLTLTGAAPATGEHAYRILVDEIPDAQQQAREAEGSRVNFRMRYSVPLFVTSEEAPQTAGQIAEGLRWEMVNDAGQRYLRIHNQGRTHARLTRVQMNGNTLAEGLLGYVLAHGSRQWPMPDRTRAGQTLVATVNGGEPVTLRHAGS